ncbi:hypothetical protein FRC12_011774 [Ceratobasidium sp. 428]|nr:hypothetical protein FRC12_011774 [Ceratobasidium sp. 428]
MQLTFHDNNSETKSQADEVNGVERQIEELHIDETAPNDEPVEAHVSGSPTIAADEADEHLVGEPQPEGHHSYHPYFYFFHRRGHHHRHHPGFHGVNVNGESAEGRPYPHFDRHHHPGHHHHHHHHPFPPPPFGPFGPGMFGLWQAHQGPPSPPSQHPEGPVPEPEGLWTMGGERRRGGMCRGRDMHHGGHGMHHGGPGMGPQGFLHHHGRFYMHPEGFGPHFNDHARHHRGRGMRMHRGGSSMGGPVEV